MARKRRDVTDAELAILQVLWDREQATIRQVTERLYPGGETSEYATVKKLIARLEEKGYVRRDAREAAHVFEAKMSRNDLLGQRLSALANDLCGGSRLPLVTNLLRAQRLTEAERQELHRFLEELIRTQRKRT
jgi:predicted transcriptional regulator